MAQIKGLEMLHYNISGVSAVVPDKHVQLLHLGLRDWALINPDGWLPKAIHFLSGVTGTAGGLGGL